MTLPTSRCFVQHSIGMFTALAMKATIDYFDYARLRSWNAVKSERDCERLKIGSATDAFRLDRWLFNIWNGAPHAAEYFEPYTWIMFPPNARHIVHDEHLVPWHQDIAYVGLLKQPLEQVVTCFIPLEERPDQTATLEFAVGDFPRLAHIPRDGHGATIVNDNFDETVSFNLDCGDCLVFGDHKPHRTIAGPNGRIDRKSIEFRMLKPESAIEGKDYFDLKTRKFVLAKELVF